MDKKTHQEQSNMSLNGNIRNSMENTGSDDLHEDGASSSESCEIKSVSDIDLSEYMNPPENEDCSSNASQELSEPSLSCVASDCIAPSDEYIKEKVIVIQPSDCTEDEQTGAAGAYAEPEPKTTVNDDKREEGELVSDNDDDDNNDSDEACIVHEKIVPKAVTKSDANMDTVNFEIRVKSEQIGMDGVKEEQQRNETLDVVQCKFTPSVGKEVCSTGEGTASAMVRYQSITAMRQFENLTPEELRFEYYKKSHRHHLPNIASACGDVPSRHLPLKCEDEINNKSAPVPPAIKSEERHAPGAKIKNEVNPNPSQFQSPYPIQTISRALLQGQMISEWQRIQKHVFHSFQKGPFCKTRLLGTAAVNVDDDGRLKLWWHTSDDFPEDYSVSEVKEEAKFCPVSEEEEMSENGKYFMVTNTLHCITAMSEYGNFSFEELRHLHYKKKINGHELEKVFVDTCCSPIKVCEGPPLPPTKKGKKGAKNTKKKKVPTATLR